MFFLVFILKHFLFFIVQIFFKYFSNLIGSIASVLKETSTKLGLALQYLIAFAVPTNVRDGTKISSFFPTPIISKIECKAEVPLIVEMTYFEFVILEIFFS